MAADIQRIKPRYPYQIPIVISAVPKRAGPRGVTRDVSEIGVYFYTDFWKPQTSTFEFRIVMPAEITGLGSSRALCRATVVRVEEGSARIGVAARIEEIVWT